MQTNQSKTNRSFSIALFDRSSISLNVSFNVSLNSLLRRDVMQVAVLTSLLCNSTSSLYLESFGANVVSGFMGGEYFVRMLLGYRHSNVIESSYHFGGILCLGWARMSVIDQFSNSIGRVFNYCLATCTNSSPGRITFGREAIASVGGTRLPISEEVFKLRNGNGGVIIDTGNNCDKIAYESLRDAYLAQTSNIPRVPPICEFEICYNLIGMKASQL
ncbi:hypothetical protein Tsubulata_034295, partial [Turnera subulata]